MLLENFKIILEQNKLEEIIKIFSFLCKTWDSSLKNNLKLNHSFLSLNRIGSDKLNNRTIKLNYTNKFLEIKILRDSYKLMGIDYNYDIKSFLEIMSEHLISFKEHDYYEVLLKTYNKYLFNYLELFSKNKVNRYEKLDSYYFLKIPNNSNYTSSIRSEVFKLLNIYYL